MSDRVMRAPIITGGAGGAVRMAGGSPSIARNYTGKKPACAERAAGERREPGELGPVVVIRPRICGLSKEQAAGFGLVGQARNGQ